jgi:hypothetical protein
MKAADDCPEPPENGECETAFNVTAFPFTATGSTLFASPLNIGGYGGGYGYGYVGDANNNNNNAGPGPYQNGDRQDGYGGGSGYNGTVDLPPPYSGCSFLDPSSKSVWYLVEGDGSCMTASVTSRNFEPSVSVLKGTECDEFACVSARENYYGGAASWRTEVDEMYYVVVGGIYGSAGDFSLKIEVSDGLGLSSVLFCRLFLTVLF